MRLAETVSQYSSLYCDSRGSGLLDCVTTRPARPRHGAAARGALRARRRGARSMAGWAVWARPVHAGWAKLVHCAPGSVLTQFLIQF